MRDLYCLWAACPCLSWSAAAMHVLTWVVFVPRASFTSMLRSGSSPSPMDSGLDPPLHAQSYVQSSWNIYMHSFKIYGIWPQTDRHTQNFCKFSHPSVGLTHARPNNVILVYADAAEGQMSALRETQPTPTSLQGESQMSKCDIVRLVGINNWG